MHFSCNDLKSHKFDIINHNLAWWHHYQKQRNGAPESMSFLPGARVRFTLLISLQDLTGNFKGLRDFEHSLDSHCASAEIRHVHIRKMNEFI